MTTLRLYLSLKKNRMYEYYIFPVNSELNFTERVFKLEVGDFISEFLINGVGIENGGGLDLRKMFLKSANLVGYIKLIITYILTIFIELVVILLSSKLLVYFFFFYVFFVTAY